MSSNVVGAVSSTPLAASHDLELHTGLEINRGGARSRSYCSFRLTVSMDVSYRAAWKSRDAGSAKQRLG
jgi:hypothetical protein